MYQKQVLFDKITRSKQRNRSQCDRMKNINIKFMLIGMILSERDSIYSSDYQVWLNDSFKCKCYHCYKQFDSLTLCKLYVELWEEYATLSNHVKERSKYIYGLRKALKKVNSGFKGY